jgi:hypothetical protein
MAVRNEEKFKRWRRSLARVGFAYDRIKALPPPPPDTRICCRGTSYSPPTKDKIIVAMNSGLQDCNAVWNCTNITEDSEIRTASILIPEDGSSMFFRNVGIYPQVHTALQHRKPTSTYSTPYKAETSTVTVFNYAKPNAEVT